MRLNPYLCFLLFSLSIIQASAQDFTTLNYDQIDSILMISYDAGDFRKGIEITKNITAPQEKKYIPSDTIYAKVIAWRSFLYDQLGEYKLAEPLLVEALRIIKDQLGDQHVYYAILVNNLGLLYKKTERPDLALETLIEAKNIIKKGVGKKHPDYALALNNLAALYKAMGMFEKAEPLLIQAKDVIKNSLGVDHLFYASSLANLASLYNATGRFELAEPLFKEEQKLTAKIIGKHHPKYAVSLNNIAHFYQTTKRNHLAEPYYVEVKKIIEESLGKDHPEYANVLSNLSLLYVDSERYDLAEATLKESLVIKEQRLGKTSPTYAISLSHLANLYKKRKEYDSSEKTYLKALQIIENALPKKHPNHIRSLTNLAGIYQINGKSDLAWDCLDKALLHTSGYHLPDTIYEAWVDTVLINHNLPYQITNLMVRSLGVVYIILSVEQREGYQLERTLICDLILGLLKKGRGNFAGDQDKLKTLEISSKWLLNSLKDINETVSPNKGFELADENKGVLLLEASGAEKAYKMGDLPDSLIRKEAKLIKNRKKLQAALLENRPVEQLDVLRAKLNQVHRDIEHFKERIAIKYPKYAAFKYQQATIKVNTLQEKLDEKTALLEYVIGDSILYIFYLDKQTVRCVEHQLDAKELRRNIKKMHQVLSDYKAVIDHENASYQNYIKLGSWFYKQLLAPVLKNTKKLKNLIIIPDGEIGYLPFEAFLTKDANQSKRNYDELNYLVNDYNISYNYSASLWQRNQGHSTTQNNHQMLAMAANYGKTLAHSLEEKRLPVYNQLRGILKPLPAAKEEVRALEKSFKGLFAFDEQASEKMLKTNASDYAVIHLAMHGLLDSKRPMLSSLVLTENGDSLENNFLQAYEISKMNLNADLVVLSACETGFGKFERGNGIASLARAFMYAGASSLIVSLWQVNDQATAQIMKTFYHNVSQGMPKDEALRKAKLTFVKKAQGVLAHPAFWSPFIQIGSTQPVTLERKANYFSFGWLLGGVLLLMGLMAWRMMKKMEL